MKIDKAGIYLPSIAFYAYNNLCIYDVYLVPASKLTDSMKGYITFNIATDPESNDGNSGLTNKVINNVDAKYHLGALSMYADTSTKTLTTKKFENSIEITEEDIADSNEEFYLFFNTGGSENTGISRTMYINIDSFSLLGEKKEEVNLDSEFTYSEENYTGGGTTLRAFAVYGTDGEVTETEIIPTPDVAYGDVAELSAPESVVKNNKKYKFLYWAKGATMEKKKIISHNAAFDYKPYEGANHLLAVYEEENATASAKEEYYNANGELLASGDVLPSMPGYGTATGWAEYKDGIYIAVYGDLEKNIEITVNGEKKKYAYGDEVICEAVAPSGKVFMYWTKDGDVVSTESTYSFCAWENAEVTAVFGDAAPTLGKTMRKIILDSFAAGDENAIMAEFIGFSDALEKGIMFGSKRVAMAGDTMQFAVIDDIANTDAVGYAIVSEDGELRLITDGEISE